METTRCGGCGATVGVVNGHYTCGYCGHNGDA